MKTLLAIALLSLSCVSHCAVLSQGQVRDRIKFCYAQTGDDNYSTIDPRALAGMRTATAKVAFRLGVPFRWDKRLDCNNLVSLFVAVNKTKYLAETWHNGESAVLGLGELWYRVATPKPLAHAVAIVLTNEGYLLYDVELGKIVDLPNNAIVFLVKF